MLSRKTYLGIVGAFLLLRLLLIFNLGFIDDEAYHWSWAKSLQISYFDHPGMVAWLIWPFIQLFGDVEWAVRLPAFFVFSAILILIYKLAKDLFDEATAQLCTLLLFFPPLWGMASLATMPDMPLGFFWILLVWLFWQAVRPDTKRWSTAKAWICIGLAMGLGMNSKLTCCLLGVGMLLYLIVSPDVRRQLLGPWPYLGAALTFLVMSPIFLWNKQHDWASFNYQFVARHQEAHFFDPGRWLQFWTQQWLLVTPGIYLMILASLVYAATHLKEARWRFLFCLPIPALALFYYQPWMSNYKPHWSGPSYMILFLGASYLFLQGIPKVIKPKSKWIAGFALIFILPMQLLYVPMFTPITPMLYAKFAPETKYDPTWDFSNDFYGWKELGAHLREMQAEIEHVDGKKPLIGAQRYEIMAQLNWAFAGVDETIWQLSRDRDHYYFLQSEPQRVALVGNNFLMVTTDKYARDPQDSANFRSCEKTNWPFYRGQFLARNFLIYYCKDLKGLR